MAADGLLVIAGRNKRTMMDIRPPFRWIYVTLPKTCLKSVRVKIAKDENCNPELSKPKGMPCLARILKRMR